MAKVIFVLQRRAGLTREQALTQWSGEQHVTIIGKLPGLTRYIQNHVGSAPAEAVCDGIGELWFATDDLMNEALNSPEMAAAVEDAKRFLDMERTGMILVQEKILVGLSALTLRGRQLHACNRHVGDHADGHLAHLFGWQASTSRSPPKLSSGAARQDAVAILARTTHLSHRPTLIWAASVLIALQPTFTLIGSSARTSS